MNVHCKNRKLTKIPVGKELSDLSPKVTPSHLLENSMNHSLKNKIDEAKVLRYPLTPAPLPLSHVPLAICLEMLCSTHLMIN